MQRVIHWLLMLSAAALGSAVSPAAFASDTGASSVQTDVAPRVSIAEAIRLVGAERLARLLQEASDRAMAEPFQLARVDDETLRFSGPITPEAVSALQLALDVGGVRTVKLDSGGGYVDAGIEMGELIRSHALAVVVDGICGSSCANYLFAAGVRRSIGPDGLLYWHGNAQQRDFREFDRCGRTTTLSGLPMLPEEVAQRRSEAGQVAARARVQRERDFLRRVGVDDYIARVGQEPTFYGNFTMTTADMARFGLTDVVAPPGYGSRKFCARLRRERPELDLHCLVVTDRMLAYERARRALGEVCAADGTLQLNLGSRNRAGSDGGGR